MPKQAVEDHDLPCSTTRRQLAPDPVWDLPAAAGPTYDLPDYHTSPTISASPPTVAASPEAEVMRLYESKLNAAGINIMLTDLFLEVRPCLQHDGTNWRCGPKRLSDASAMKRLKIMHMEPSFIFFNPPAVLQKYGH